MTPEAQRIAIAEACGWASCYMEANFRLTGYPPDNTTRTKLPKYTTDLNAMHEAEKVLTREQVPEYVRYVWDQVSRTCDDYVKAACFFIGHATAAQRAEAFLRAIGKWDDTK
jgi:hypothetical protein